MAPKGAQLVASASSSAYAPREPLTDKELRAIAVSSRIGISQTSKPL